jgi:hypothetical protein
VNSANPIPSLLSDLLRRNIAQDDRSGRPRRFLGFRIPLHLVLCRLLHPLVFDRSSWTTTSTPGLHLPDGMYLRCASRPHLEGRNYWIQGRRCRSNRRTVPLHGSLHHRIPGRRLGLPFGNLAATNAIKGFLHQYRCQLDLQLCYRRDDPISGRQHWLQVLHHLRHPQCSLGSGHLLHVPCMSLWLQNIKRR